MMIRKKKKQKKKTRTNLTYTLANCTVCGCITVPTHKHNYMTIQQRVHFDEEQFFYFYLGFCCCSLKIQKYTQESTFCNIFVAQVVDLMVVFGLSGWKKMGLPVNLR
jgi:hypothetical protein